MCKYGTGWHYSFSVFKKQAIPHLSEELNDIDMVFLIVHLAISFFILYRKYEIDYEVDGQ